MYYKCASIYTLAIKFNIFINNFKTIIFSLTKNIRIIIYINEHTSTRDLNIYCRRLTFLTYEYIKNYTKSSKDINKSVF